MKSKSYFISKAEFLPAFAYSLMCAQGLLALAIGIEPAVAFINLFAIGLVGFIPAACSAALLILAWYLNSYYLYLLGLTLPLAVLSFLLLIKRHIPFRLIRPILVSESVLRIFPLLAVVLFLQAVGLIPQFISLTYSSYDLDVSGRAAAFFLEPSFVAPALFCYIAAYELHGRIARRDSASVMLFAFSIASAVLSTRSISVLLVALVPLVTSLKLSTKIGLFDLAFFLGVCATSIFAVQRIMPLLASSTLSAAITVGLGSWRNVPDLAMISDPLSWALPSPANLRTLISESISRQGSLDIYSYVDSVFTFFSSIVSSFGLCAIALFLFATMLRLPRDLSVGVPRLYSLFLLLFVLPKVFFLPWIYFLALICSANSFWRPKSP